MTRAKKISYTLAAVAAVILLTILSEKFFFRIDLTAEKRYSISDNTKKLLRNLDNELKVTVYLDGDLNSGFLRLRKATKEMLDEFNVYAEHGVSYEFVNPSAATSSEERNKKYAELEKRGLRQIPVYDKDEEGKSVMKIVFPWAEISYKRGDDTVVAAVNLLKNLAGKSGGENLNLSVQSLEFELTNTIRMITSSGLTKIAFIDGHKELPEPYVWDSYTKLSEYYQVDRGVIGTDPSILDPYKAIVIAGPQEKFSEQDKYVIDQYIMNGGKVLWLIDGVKISLDSLSSYSETVGVAHDVNLSDQLFKYGVRINPVLLQDVQCALVPVNMSREGDQPKFEPAPWYYSPLLLASPFHPVSKNITPVKSEFVSSIDFVGNRENVKQDVLLITSTGTHVQNVPSIVSMDIINIEKNGVHFNAQNKIAAVSMEGIFPSVFANRMIPNGITTNKPTVFESKPTKMIVVADGDIIKNDIDGQGSKYIPMPLGYDRYMNQQFGNSEFVLNAVNYLTDDDGWMELRSREIALRLLNKPAIIGQRKFWQWVNVLLPLAMLGLFGLGFHFFNKRRYTR